MSEFDKILAKYDALTGSLDFSNIIRSNGGNFLELETLSGHSYCRGILKNDQIAIMDCFNSKGSVLKNHQHDTKELVIVWEGTLTIITKQDTRILTAGDMYYINPHTEHVLESEEDCRYICITIPADKGYVV